MTDHLSSDARRKQNPEGVIREATALRERGLTWKAIAPVVGASPAWLSMYMPAELRHLTSGQLADRRESHATGVPLATLSEQRRQRWILKAIARTEPERVIMLVAKAQSVDARLDARRQYEHERKQFLDRRRREQIGYLGWAHPLRLDAPGEAESDAAMHEAIARPLDDTDPQTYVEGQLLDAIVGDLSIDDIQRLDEHSLSRLQERLLDAGFRPGLVQGIERERLREVAPHRGSAPSRIGKVSLGSGRSTNTKRRQKVADARHGRPSHQPVKAWR